MPRATTEATGDLARPGPPADAPLSQAYQPKQPSPHAARNAIQVHDSYIVAACEDGVVIIDQHALHERILYNELERRIGEAPLVSQRLLIPETVQATPEEADVLQTHAELLNRLGIEIEPFGPNTIAVQRFPSLLIERGVAPGKFVRALGDLLAEEETAGAEKLLENVLAMIACKAAVKAGEPLSPTEIDDLLARREKTEKASACPHGRPTALKLSIKDLEKQFRRT